MLMTLMMMIALSRFTLTHDADGVDDDSLILMIVDDIDDAACIVEVYLDIDDGATSAVITKT